MTSFRFRHGTAAIASDHNLILAAGEPGIELDTGKFKIGDGVTPWLELDYYLPLSSDIPDDNGSALAALSIHINSETPHPVYDDGPSLALIYENAKV